MTGNGRCAFAKMRDTSAKMRVCSRRKKWVLYGDTKVIYVEDWRCLRVIGKALVYECFIN